jgi:hypothetical protein
MTDSCANLAYPGLDINDVPILQDNGDEVTFSNLFAGLSRTENLPDAWPYFWNGSNGQGGGPVPENWRINRRLLVGEASQVDDWRTNVPGHGLRPDWGDSAMWMPGDSQFAVMTTKGNIAGSFMARTLQKSAELPVPSTSAIMGYLKNDKASAFGRVFYGESQRESGAGGSPILELVGKNKGSNATSTPYFTQNSIEGIWLVAGGDPAYGGDAVNPCNTGLAFRSGNSAAGNSWNKGIVFEHDSLTGTVGAEGVDAGFGVAMEMGKNHRIQARASDNSTTGYIQFSKGAEGGYGAGIDFRTNAIFFTNRLNDVIGLEVQSSTGGESHIKIMPGATGNNAAIITAVSDVGATDVPIMIKGLGDAGLRYVADTLNLRAAFGPSEASSGRYLDNRLAVGGVPITLPACTPGLVFTLTNTTAFNTSFVAGGSDTIQIGAETGTTAVSTALGDSVTLVGDSESVWLARAVIGTWTVT